MAEKLDDTDIRILRFLQRDATLTVDQISERVNLSRNACWRRIRQMEDAGVIRARVAIVDADAAGFPQLVIVRIRTNAHEPDWLVRFRRAVVDLPEIVGAYRVSGELDYVLKVRVRDVRDYDRFYQRLIGRVEIADVAASFVMEDMKDTTALPI